MRMLAPRRRVEEHGRDDQYRAAVGPARPSIGQAAGWDRLPPATRLEAMNDVMNTDTAVLPSMPPPTSAPRPAGWLRQLAVDSGYVFTAFPVAIAAFVVVVAGLSAGAGLLVVWVGVAVLAGTLLATRGFAALERGWLPAVLHRDVPRPGYLRGEGRQVRRLLTPLRDPQSWLD